MSTVENVQAPFVQTYLPKPSAYNVTANELLQMMIKKILNPNPVGQRVAVDKTDKKSTGIIVSILEGSDIGELTFQKLKNDKLEVCDGGHRSRAILEFMTGELQIPKNCNVKLQTSEGEVEIAGLFYKDLPKAVQKYFDEYVIRVIEYVDLSSVQATKIFRNRNQSTQTNHQEMMNAASYNVVAKLVRETARNIPDHTSEYKLHRLFTVDYETEEPLVLAKGNNRLSWDEWVAIMLIYSINNGIVDAGYPEIEQLYDVYGDEERGIFTKDAKALNRANTLLQECLDFCNNVAHGLKQLFGKKGASNDRMVMAARYFFYLKSQKKDFKLTSAPTFAAVLSSAIYNLVGKPGKDAQPALEKWQKRKVDSAITKDAQAEHFANLKMREWMTGYHAEAGKVLQTVKWLEEAMDDVAENLDDGEIGITFKDSKRVLGQSDKQILLAKQNFTCYVDGKALSLKDAAAGHIIPHCDGGETTLANCRMIRREYNTESGSMNLDEYKVWKRKQLGLDPQ